MNPDHSPPTSKVYYRPLEAAIRWCGLEQHEQSIVHAIAGKTLPEPEDFPQWPTLRLNTERIFDAMANHDLPFGIDGVTVHGAVRLDHPGLTIRHVDLRIWMVRFYPRERPFFLFDPAEFSDASAPGDVQLAFRERDELRTALTEREETLRELRKQIALSPRAGTRPTSPIPGELTVRAESTYLHIIGVMLRLMIGQRAPGQRPASFSTQESLVNAMVDQFGKELMGITERTLHAKFAAANRKLEGR